MTLGVVGSGVTLVSGHIIKMITLDGGGTQHSISNEPAVAGTGYVDLSTRRRRLPPWPRASLQLAASRYRFAYPLWPARLPPHPTGGVLHNAS